MRAFMSEPQEWNGGDDGSRSIFGPLAQMAEAEARMILAETRADSSGPIAGLRECIGAEWADACEDALRAFVED